MTYGYIFLFSNPVHPNVYYFNYSRSNPLDILKKMNSNEGNVFDFEMVFAKYVDDYDIKGQIIESLLHHYDTCVNIEKNFFVVEKSIIQSYFALCNGEWIDI